MNRKDGQVYGSGPWTCNGKSQTSKRAAVMSYVVRSTDGESVADRSRWRLPISDVRVQQSVKYCGALPCYHW